MSAEWQPVADGCDLCYADKARLYQRVETGDTLALCDDCEDIIPADSSGNGN